MNIKDIFHKYKVRTTEHKYDFIEKNNFPEKLSWIYELLLLIPFEDQTERDESVDKLPEGLIREIFELFKKDESIYLDWQTGSSGSSKESYYSYLVLNLIEEKYIHYTWNETLPEKLKYFREEAERMIEV